MVKSTAFYQKFAWEAMHYIIDEVDNSDFYPLLNTLC